MGALSEKIPVTYKTMFVATLAIAGVPPLAGFFSKDEILHKLHGAHFFRFGSLELPGLGAVLWMVASASAMLTAFYMTRQVYCVFFGKSRATPEVQKHIHESPWTMTMPLVVLAGLAVVGGAFGFIFKEE